VAEVDAALVEVVGRHLDGYFVARRSGGFGSRGR
jgi:hypothetical protein